MRRVLTAGLAALLATAAFAAAPPPKKKAAPKPPVTKTDPGPAHVPGVARAGREVGPPVL
jgi:hypothetical protein